jgi:cell division protein FtsB
MRFYRGNYQFPSEPRKKTRRLLLAMPVMISVYLIVAGDSGLYQVWHREGQIDALREEIEALFEKNVRLQEEVGLLKDDLKTIERIARERYGMVKANESVYMVYPYPPENRMEGER